MVKRSIPRAPAVAEPDREMDHIYGEEAELKQAAAHVGIET
jgi:hypothetical protein